MSAGVRLHSRPLTDCIVGTGTFIGKGQAVIDFVGQFVAGNTFDLTINAVAIVQVPFATDHNTTMRNIATSIDNLASVRAVVVKGEVGGVITRILIEGVVEGVDLTLSSLVIAGGASRPVAQIAPGSSGSYQEQPALLVWEPAGSGDATAANQLLILAQVTSKINRIKGASNYNRAFTFAAAEGAPGGANATVITHTGTTVVGVETVVETITYSNPLIDNSRITNIAYS